MAKKILKYCLIVVVFIVLTFIVTLLNSNLKNKKYDRWLKSDQFIYEKLKSEDNYATAKIKGNEIVLYDESFGEIKTITLDSAYKEKLSYIEKRKDSIIFWHTGAVDDTSGIMFLDGEWSDDTWNGLVRVTWLARNGYEVHTFR